MKPDRSWMVKSICALESDTLILILMVMVMAMVMMLVMVMVMVMFDGDGDGDGDGETKNSTCFLKTLNDSLSKSGSMI